MTVEHLRPPRPSAAYFDPEREAWVLSRYCDVVAAFRDPRLWTIGGDGTDQTEVRDDSGKLSARGAMQEALSYSKVAEWQKQFDAIVSAVVAGLPGDRPVDLLGDFSQPCCLPLAILITGADPADAPRLGGLGEAAFAGTGSAEGSEVKIHAVEARAELNRYFENSPFRMGEPTFVGTSQTMARLLACGWLALLLHADEWQRLRNQPDLMPSAVEELLRFAGIVPTLYRRSTADLEIGAAHIRKGQPVHLMIASANRDPEQFPDPDRLDVGRRAVNQLALGIGRNSCVGNLVIRMAMSCTTGALLRAFPKVRLAGEVQWKSSPSFSWADRIPVMLDSAGR